MNYRLLLFILCYTWCFTIVAQLSGTYTVGGASPDYADITTAVSDLNTSGTSGNVTFDIRPGTYTGNYLISATSPSTHFVIFRSSTMNASDVILEYTATGTSDNYIFKLDSAKRISFNRLSFRAMGFDYSRCIDFVGPADLLQVDRCVLQGSGNTASAQYPRRALINCLNSSSGSLNANDVIITNNTFIDGSAAINLDYGFGFPHATGIIIADNNMNNQSYVGVNIKRAVGQIDENIITTDVGFFYTGIRTLAFANGSQIRRNVIQAYSSNDVTGIEFSNTQFGTACQLSNNMIYASGADEVRGLMIFNLFGGDRIVYNTVVVEDGLDTLSKAFAHISSFADGQDCVVQNNIFANYTGGQAMYVKVAGNVDIEDYNDLHSSGSELIQWDSLVFSSLNDYQVATMNGANSVSIDPYFPALPDLHHNSCLLDDLGLYIVSPAIDIDLDVRSTTTPDIGADEYSYDPNAEFTVVDTISSTQTPYTLTAPDGGPYLWTTGESTQSIQVSASNTYSCMFTDANGCSATVAYELFVEISTGIDEEKRTSGLVYPNPCQQVLHFSSGGSQPYRTFDLQGNLVLLGKSSSGKIDLQSLTPAMYVIQTGTKVARFIKK